MKSLKISKFELLFYIISALCFLTGLVFAILGVIGDNLSPNNPIYVAQLKFMSYRYFGIILISAGAILVTFTFLFFGRTAEKKAEREERRKQRLELAEKIGTEEEHEEIKEIESTPVEEKEETEVKEIESPKEDSEEENIKDIESNDSPESISEKENNSEEEQDK